VSTRRSSDTEPDPYALDLPASWTVDAEGDTVVYENGRESVRVQIREFSRNLALYWWVDVYVRGSAAEGWSRCEIGGESYRDPAAAAAEAQSLVEATADGGGVAAIAGPATDGGSATADGE
jgi:hypothetical protein